MTESPAREFLDACADIENTLHKRYNMDPSVRTLGAVIREAASRDSVVRRYQNELQAFTELRNAISHNRYQGGAPIATPLPETVTAIQKIRNELVEPTKVLTAVQGKSYYSVGSTDPLRPHLLYMTEHAFAQAPIHDDVSESPRTMRMLTTNAVARWVGASMDADGDVIVEGASVADVLKHAEDHEVAELVARDMSVADAVERLLSPRAPLALIVTHSGKKTEKPLGLLVAADLPDLLKSFDTPNFL